MSTTITYNGKTVTFPYSPTTFQVSPLETGRELESWNGVARSTLSRAIRASVVAVWPRTFERSGTDLALLQEVEAFLSWMRTGGAFAFALDSTKASDTKLNGEATTGDGTLTVDDDTGFADDDFIVVRTGTLYEDLQINGTPAANVITLEATINATMPDDAIVRHKGFIRGKRIPGTERSDAIRRPSHALWGLQLSFVEDVSAY